MGVRPEPDALKGRGDETTILQVIPRRFGPDAPDPLRRGVPEVPVPLAGQVASMSENVAVARVAKCGCGRAEPSSKHLAFFQDRGPDSKDAQHTCKQCHYYDVAHTPEVMARNKNLKCTDFEPHGAFEFDSFYCGCRGWD